MNGSENVLRRQSVYAKANQFKRTRKSTRQLKTILDRVIRDIRRKTVTPDAEFKNCLNLVNGFTIRKRVIKTNFIP